MDGIDFSNQTEVSWCPGCGNFGILLVLKKILKETKIKPENIVLVSGIGQAAKTPQYINSNFFNGLHGRALPPATGIKAANPELKVIVTSGDGDMYGEGGNHFLHAIRRNPDITIIVHDNMIYGLTKGQASPTSEKGMKTVVQTTGVILEPINPISLAISLDASFVARANIGDLKETSEILNKAIEHKGLSIVDILQPCTTFNKINTYKWFKENTYYLDKDYNPKDREKAILKSLEIEKMPLGIIYISKNKKTFEEMQNVYQKNKLPLYKRKRNLEKLKKMIKI
jgi:2-oxoglutarate ferredoxin oxidoreductase subunit beta